MAQASKNSLLDYFMNRKSKSLILPYLDKIVNFIDFVKLFYVSNNSLKLRTEPHRIVVLCFPKVRYNPTNASKLINYCYYQLIRYSSWDIDDLNEISNKNTAVLRWNEFIKNASTEVLSKINYV
jgi:hypothetical protein